MKGPATKPFFTQCASVSVNTAPCSSTEPELAIMSPGIRFVCRASTPCVSSWMTFPARTFCDNGRQCSYLPTRDANDLTLTGVVGTVGRGLAGNFAQKLAGGVILYEVSTGISGHFTFAAGGRGGGGVYTGECRFNHRRMCAQAAGNPIFTRFAPGNKWNWEKKIKRPMAIGYSYIWYMKPALTSNVEEKEKQLVLYYELCTVPTDTFYDIGCSNPIN